MAETRGHRLAMARHAKRLSQHEVAKRVGITPKHLSQLERDHVPVPSVAGRTLLRLARLLGVSLEYLLGSDLPDDDMEQGEDPPLCLFPPG
jgi:transcriptional regulator with XRE-family HTH domain